MLTAPLTLDYVGTLRHEGPKFHRAAAIRQFILRDENWNVVSNIDYCQWIDCGWKAPR